MSLQIVDLHGKPFDTPLDRGNQINFGKTKQVFQLPDGNLALEHKGVITAYDDPRFTGISTEKGIVSAYSSAVIFKRLNAAGIPTSHLGILNANTTNEMPLEMDPLELIWRRYNVAGNSWMKRYPNNSYAEGDGFDEIIYEVCLKWSVEDLDAMEEKDKIVHDPFLVLDDDFKPQLRSDGMPRLTHSKTGKELNYSVVTHPNKGGVIQNDEVIGVIEGFMHKRTRIREMVKQVQRITFETYAQIGLINADGKIEVGVDKDGRIILGDELELDTLRNMSPTHIRLSGNEHYFDSDLLGQSLYDILNVNPMHISRIITASHSGKQHYRNQVIGGGDKPFDNARKAYNNEAARRTTAEIYTPVALALSERFSQEVGYKLIHTN